VLAEQDRSRQRDLPVADDPVLQPRLDQELVGSVLGKLVPCEHLDFAAEIPDRLCVADTDRQAILEVRVVARHREGGTHQYHWSPRDQTTERSGRRTSGGRVGSTDIGKGITCSFACFSAHPVSLVSAMPWEVPPGRIESS